MHERKSYEILKSYLEPKEDKNELEQNCIECEWNFCVNSSCQNEYCPKLWKKENKEESGLICNVREAEMLNFKLGISLSKYLRNNQLNYKMKISIVNFVKDMIKDLWKKIIKICITTMLVPCSLFAISVIKAFRSVL